MKKGFTIVELLMVMGILAVLMGIVTTAASESLRASRARRADALCQLVEAGFSNYYAQYDEWPGSLGKRIASGSIGTRANQEGTDGSSNTEEYLLDLSESQDCIRALIDETKKGRPVMDISGLFVSRSDGEPQPVPCDCRRSSGHRKYVAKKGSYGMDFMAAIHGTKRSPNKMSTRQMSFGYPHPDDGRFMRFKIVYSIPTDSFKVTQWHWPGVSE